MDKINSFLYKILYPVHLLSWMGFFVYLINFDFTIVELCYLILGWIIIEGVGVAVVLHRYVSHRAFEAKPYIKPVLLWIACLSLQGSPIGWAAIHRGSHHRYSDTEKDAHSPIKGKWYAWHAWLHDWDQYFNAKFAVDLLRDPMHIWFAKNYNKIILVTYLVVGLISWKLLLFGFMIPACISLYQESNINVFCHSGTWGYRTFETKDNSRNVPFLAWITWGQGWHNNHHQLASSYDFGSTVSGNPKEFDMSLLLLPLVATKESKNKIYQDRHDKLHSQ